MPGQSLLRNLAVKSTRRPYLSVIGGLCLAVASLYYTAENLEFQTSRNELVSADQQYVVLQKQYEQVFTGLDEFIAVIGAPTPKATHVFADRLAADLQRNPQHIQEVLYRANRGWFEGKKLLFLPKEDLDELTEGILDNEDLIESFFESPSLNIV
ncbi:MAG: hypothetical protein QF886_17525, partial [Planctomycetota bacterium]|nr:hypothetical protein [Planctomycetota bacterium]